MHANNYNYILSKPPHYSYYLLIESKSETKKMHYSQLLSSIRTPHAVLLQPKRSRRRFVITHI